MKKKYIDLIEQTFEYPQVEFKTDESGHLVYHDIPLMELIQQYGSPIKFTYLPKISESIQNARTWFNVAIAKADYKGKYRCKVLIFMDKLKNGKFREHFDKITFVENMDFQDVIEKYDSPTSYFYTDPPYWKTENYYSNHDFDRSDHERLADCLKNSKGRYSLSYYDFPLLQKWFPYTDYKWEKKGFKKSAAAKKDGTQNTGIEILIMNYGQPSYKEGEQLSMFELKDDEKDKTKKVLVPRL